MNRDDTLALFKQAKEAWNKWAAEVDARRNDNDAWADEAKVDFVDHVFEDDADFSGFDFPGTAVFENASFKYDAWFSCANFKGGAWFSITDFKGDAWFENTDFNGGTNFISALFKYNARFISAKFKGDASFVSATFEGYANFEDSVFERTADFTVASAVSAFNLHRAVFRETPEFAQVSFSEAPRLDNLCIGPRRFRHRITHAVKWFRQRRFAVKLRILGIMSRREAALLAVEIPACLIAVFKGDADQADRWRSLKRLAVQGHNHAQEQRFFREELRARRWVEDRPWHVAYFFGYLYQIFSGFGRSVAKPLFWWTAGLFGFAGYYLGRSLGEDRWLDGVAGMWRRIGEYISGDPLAMTCGVGATDPGAAALGLSLHRGFAALSGLSGKLGEFHACLYGGTAKAPIVPDAVAFVGVGQSVYSAIMIFLVLLAVRNHFRIK